MDLHVPFEKRMLGLDVSFHGESVVSAGACSIDAYACGCLF